MDRRRLATLDQPTKRRAWVGIFLLGHAASEVGLPARDHRVLIPASVLLGGSFLMIADSFARSIVAPLQLPVGVVTAIIGVPTFLLILRRSQQRSVE